MEQSPAIARSNPSRYEPGPNQHLNYWLVLGDFRCPASDDKVGSIQGETWASQHRTGVYSGDKPRLTCVDGSDRRRHLPMPKARAHKWPEPTLASRDSKRHTKHACFAALPDC